MGGDYGPKVIVPAALEALDRHRKLKLILVGDEHEITQHLPTKPSKRLMIHHASQVVTMDELPSSALRGKKDSSMRVAINLVKKGDASACVSAGNTGALMATARFVLKTLPGIDRPAIISALPTTLLGKVYILDLGANVDSCAEHLCQFAVMGSVLVTALENNPKPRVGLLNIGTEEIKGNDQVKRTAQLLAEIEGINYIGYLEGDAISRGVADVVVCDGFVGNVALKTLEGTANLMQHFLKKAFQSTFYSRLVGLATLPVLRRLKKQIDPSHYNGATFLGLQGIVIKSHGSANVLGFTEAINKAVLEVAHNVPDLIREQVGQILHEDTFS